MITITNKQIEGFHNSTIHIAKEKIIIFLKEIFATDL